MTIHKTRWLGTIFGAAVASAAFTFLPILKEGSASVGTPMSAVELRHYRGAGTQFTTCEDSTHCQIDPCFSPMDAGKSCQMCSSSLIQALCAFSGNNPFNFCMDTTMSCGSKLSGTCTGSPLRCANTTQIGSCSGFNCVNGC